MFWYHVINLMTCKSWEGVAHDAKEAYSHLIVNKGDTTYLARNGRCVSVKDW